MSVFLMSVVLVLVTVGVHYEALRWAIVLVDLLPMKRLRVAAAIVIAVAAHLVEITIFGFGWFALDAIQGASMTQPDPHLSDHLYFSGVVYTSLGFGDVLPVHSARLLAVVEAVLGLVLIAWTASFSYFEMRRNWRNGRASD